MGVLGATGTVGTRLVHLLQDHPWFHLSEIGASRESAGRPYSEAASLDEREAPSEQTQKLTLKGPGEEWTSTVLISALPSEVAEETEVDLAARGHLLVSNASSHRLDPDVPLVIPEVNPDHLELIERQAKRWPGSLVTNPNCSVVGLALALAPLHRSFGIDSVVVTTLQSLSGAGRRGLQAADLRDNVVPHIPGEEEKIAREPLKILGRLGERGIEPADFVISAQAHRVPVTQGHMLSVSVKLDRPAKPREVAEVLAGFQAADLDRSLPSAPTQPIHVIAADDRPQPRLDRERAGGMTVIVGRVRRCPALDVKFSVLVDNLVRGAAGAALLNAELCHACGLTARTRVA